MLVMRSLLFVPANRANMVERAHQAPADVIVLDLEDSVPAAEKEAARRGLREAIVSLKAAGKSVHVRVNHIDTGMTRDDLAAAMGPDLDGLAFPKTSSPRDIRQLDVLIREQELHAGVRAGTVALIPHIESARGLLGVEEIIEASTRIVGLALGPYDFAADLGVTRTPAGRELEYARGVIVTACAAYGLQALDGPYANFEDAAGLRAEAQLVRSLGYRGKYVIHPDQVGPVNEAFTPSAEELDNARRVVAAFEEAVAAGHGTVGLNGRMVDGPIAKRAREIIAYADEIAGRG
jgi:citrate lyase subunit beta/citryl-CoA lyase